MQCSAREALGPLDIHQPSKHCFRANTSPSIMALWVYILLKPPIQGSEWHKRINNQSFLSIAINVQYLNTVVLSVHFNAHNTGCFQYYPSMRLLCWLSSSGACFRKLLKHHTSKFHVTNFPGQNNFVNLWTRLVQKHPTNAQSELELFVTFLGPFLTKFLWCVRAHSIVDATAVVECRCHEGVYFVLCTSLCIVLQCHPHECQDPRFPSKILCWDEQCFLSCCL